MEIGHISLDFDYQGEDIEDIKRCLSTLYSIAEGSQPMDRDLGISWDFVGMPIPVAQNLFSLEVVEKTELYEDRVKVAYVTFEIDAVNGKMNPTIHLTRRDG